MNSSNITSTVINPNECNVQDLELCFSAIVCRMMIFLTDTHMLEASVNLLATTNLLHDGKDRIIYYHFSLKIDSPPSST